jgi:hypothetical protein
VSRVTEPPPPPPPPGAYTQAEVDSVVAITGRLARLIGRAELLLEVAVADLVNGPAWNQQAKAWLKDAAATMLSGGADAAEPEANADV